MCLIETYLQMANIDAQLKQSNGLVSLDDNNNSEAKVMRENGPPARIAPKDNIAALTSEMEKLSPGGSPVPPNTPATGSSSPTSSESTESFASLFKIFAKFGDSKSAGDAITLSNSDKWFKQAKIIDGKTITTTDTGIYFKQVAKYDAIIIFYPKLTWNGIFYQNQEGFKSQRV